MQGLLGREEEKRFISKEEHLIDTQKCQKFAIFLLSLNPFNELKYKKYLFPRFHERFESMIKKITHLGHDRA